jgi:hypothetical protein
MAAIDTAEECAGQIPYTFGGSRYDFWEGTDCSGLVCSALYKTYGIDPYSFGDWTGAQWSDTNYTDQIWWGTTADLPWDDMQRGDLIFTSNCSEDFSTGEGSHIGFYTGDPSNPFYSHFATYGPRWTAVNGVYGNECYYGVKRLKVEAGEQSSNDDENPDDVWNFDQNGVLMRDRIQGTDEATNAANSAANVMREQLTRTDDVSGRGTEANLYERMCWMGARTAEISDKLDELINLLKE